MKKKVLLVFLNVFWGFISGVFIESFIQYYDWTFFIPSVIFSILTIVFSYLLFVEIFLGHKIYTYDDSSLYIWRKDKMKKCIPKEGISKIVLILDVFTEELYLISFVYEDKKHYLSINKENKEDILIFINGKRFVQKKNWWYYLIVFLSH
jgi:hypothetical protein